APNGSANGLAQGSAAVAGCGSFPSSHVLAPLALALSIAVGISQGAGSASNCLGASAAKEAWASWKVCQGSARRPWLAPEPAGFSALSAASFSQAAGAAGGAAWTLGSDALLASSRWMG